MSDARSYRAIADDFARQAAEAASPDERRRLDEEAIRWHARAAAEEGAAAGEPEIGDDFVVLPDDGAPKRTP